MRGGGRVQDPSIAGCFLTPRTGHAEPQRCHRFWSYYITLPFSADFPSRIIKEFIRPEWDAYKNLIKFLKRKIGKD